MRPKRFPEEQSNTSHGHEVTARADRNESRQPGSHESGETSHDKKKYAPSIALHRKKQGDL